jgi:protein-disulfide isomerase
LTRWLLTARHLDSNAQRRLDSGQSTPPRIREDFSSGVRSGVNGTPTFYINDARYNGAWDLESLGAALKLASAAPIGASR